MKKMEKIGTDHFQHEYYYDPSQKAVWVAAGYITLANFRRGFEEGLINLTEEGKKLIL